MRRLPGTVLSATRLLAAVALGAGLLGGCGPRQSPTAQVQEAAALIPPEPETAGPQYRIGVGDELHVRFLYQPDNNEQLPVRPDGRITLGATGEIDVVGKTPSEVEQIVVERASTRLRDPEVTVIVTKLGIKQVYVGGEVLKPGIVPLQPGMTPLQAIMQSGGFKPTAKLASTLLITPTAEGKFSAARINLQQVVEDGVVERVRLRANEIVFVPQSWIGNLSETTPMYVRGLFPFLGDIGANYRVNP